MQVENYIFCFFIYAFLGYLCEVAYCSILQKRLVNRGYLYMPLCPIYGFGALIILLTMQPIIDMWYLVLLLGILLTSTLEYLTSYVMELVFHMRWWDYSQRKFNINGRVCLRNSLMFGALVMIVLYGLQPVFINLMSYIPTPVLWTLNAILLVGILIDMVLSTIKNINIAKIVAKINQLADDATDKLKEFKQTASEKFNETKLKLKNFISRYPSASFRRVGKEKKRLSINEFISNHLNSKDEE